MHRQTAPRLGSVVEALDEAGLDSLPQKLLRSDSRLTFQERRWTYNLGRVRRGGIQGLLQVAGQRADDAPDFFDAGGRVRIARAHPEPCDEGLFHPFLMLSGI